MNREQWQQKLVNAAAKRVPAAPGVAEIERRAQLTLLAAEVPKTPPALPQTFVGQQRS